MKHTEAIEIAQVVFMINGCVKRQLTQPTACGQGNTTTQSIPSKTTAGTEDRLTKVA
jgi:hypothetical protein